MSLSESKTTLGDLVLARLEALGKGGKPLSYRKAKKLTGIPHTTLHKIVHGGVGYSSQLETLLALTKLELDFDDIVQAGLVPVARRTQT